MTNETKFGGLRDFDITPFQTVLLEELIPYIANHFRTKADQKNTAMAGLSMGGFETKLITTNNPDIFSPVKINYRSLVKQKSTQHEPQIPNPYFADFQLYPNVLFTPALWSTSQRQP